MTDMVIEVDLEIRKLISTAAEAERTAAAAVHAAKVAQDNVIAAKLAVEQALTSAANKGFHISWWEFRK